MAERAVLLNKVQLYFDSPGGGVEHAESLYHDDAVLEFPQSGERFDGRDTFTEWRSRYPVEVSFRVRRVTVCNELVVVELSASYEGGATMFGVALLEFRGERIARERIYVMDGWEAPDWRRAWRSQTPADPPE